MVVFASLFNRMKMKKRTRKTIPVPLLWTMKSNRKRITRSKKQLLEHLCHNRLTLFCKTPIFLLIKARINIWDAKPRTTRQKHKRRWLLKLSQEPSSFKTINLET